MTAIEYEVDDLSATLDEISRDLTPEQLDAAASSSLRIIGAIERDIARYRGAEELEIEHIRATYRKRCEPLEQRAAQFREAVAEMARRATFPGKSRSRETGFGIYGLRKVPESVKITDQERALDFARGAAPHAIVTVSKASVMAKEIKPVVLAHLKETGEIPAGFEHIAERDEPVIKVWEVQ
jgi:phage host-nuclease inhibitor protein Gam